MHRRELLLKLERYAAATEAEREVQRRFRQFVESEPRCFLRSLSVGHVTASAWIVDPESGSVLLTHHRKLGRWLQIGGHADGKSDTLAVAQREVAEEAGLLAMDLKLPEIFDLDIHEIPGRPDEPAHLHYDVRYLFTASASAKVRAQESESLAVRWIAPREVEQLSPDASLLRMLHKAGTLLGLSP